MKLKEIGKWFGIGESGVTQASRRVTTKAEINKKISKTIDKIAGFVNV